MKFIIDRSKWRNGGISRFAKGQGRVQLLNNEGSMCCLGQISKQLGCMSEDIIDIATPSIHIKGRSSRFNELLLKGYDQHSFLTKTAMKINDDNSTTSLEKESLLKELFKKEGHEIKFINNTIKYKQL